MLNNLDKYKSDLESLVKLGETMELDLTLRRLEDKAQLSEGAKETFKKLKGSFEKHYQCWYTESTAIIRQLLPDRITEFEYLYKGDGKRKSTVQPTMCRIGLMAFVLESINLRVILQWSRCDSILNWRYSTP